jgi:hypothetical protein
MGHDSEVPGWLSSSSHDCPARGPRVNGGPAGRRTRSATPTIDPATTPKDFGAYEDDGEE